MTGQILNLDVIKGLSLIPRCSVQCVITSPPYWGLRDYEVDGQIGLEKTPGLYVRKIVKVMAAVRRVLRTDGTLWLNLGDCYTDGGRGTEQGSGLEGSRENQKESRKVKVREGFRGLPKKNLLGIPWRVAFALQADGWYLRSDIIWAKPNPMPESAKDRPTRSHEHMFLLAKSRRYYFDADAVRTPYKEGDGQPHSPGAIKSPHGQGFTRLAKVPSGWDTGPGDHDILRHNRDKKRGHPRPHHGALDRGEKSDQQAKGANIRDVWWIATAPYHDAHRATFPEKLVEPCILAGSRQGDTVLDPFSGSGTVLSVSEVLGRKWIGIDISAKFTHMARRRTAQMGIFS